MFFPSSLLHASTTASAMLGKSVVLAVLLSAWPSRLQWFCCLEVRRASAPIPAWSCATYISVWLVNHVVISVEINQMCKLRWIQLIGVIIEELDDNKSVLQISTLLLKSWLLCSHCFPEKVLPFPLFAAVNCIVCKSQLEDYAVLLPNLSGKAIALFLNSRGVIWSAVLLVRIFSNRTFWYGFSLCYNMKNCFHHSVKWKAGFFKITAQKSNGTEMKM